MGRSGKSSPERRIWYGMVDRCTNPNYHEWHKYGGRGITVDQRWLDFEAFLADMGPRPSPDHSLDRIDNDGPYAPGNVRWATGSQQQRNRRDTLKITYKGESVAVADLAERLGLDIGTLKTRLRQGRPEERLGEPARVKAKLDKEKVAEIRRRYAAGESLGSIGRSFGVHHSTCRRAIDGVYWKDPQ